jgi:HemY protein
MVRLILLCVIFASGIGGAYWLSRNSGDLVFTFMDFKVETTVTEFFVYCTLILILLQFILFWLYRLFSIPANIKRHLKDKKRDKLIANLSGFIVAYIAKNTSEMDSKYKSVKQLVNSQTQLSMAFLIEEANCNVSDIKNKLVLLTKEPSTQVAAFKELIQIAIKENEWFIAANYCSELWKISKSEELARQYVTSFINSKRWRELEEMLDTGSVLTSLFSKDIKYYLGKKNALTVSAICKYKIAEELIEFGDREKAEKYAMQAIKTLGGFIPATNCAIKAIISNADHNAVIKLIKRQWKVMPHHLLSQVIFDFSRKTLDEKLYKIVKNIAATNPEHYESHLILARAALDSDQFDMASIHISEALSGVRKLRACLMMAEFCQRTHANKAEIIDWIRQALMAANDKAIVNYYWDFEKSDWVYIADKDSVYVDSV